jgi:2,4-diaminopentanoate dehydrogenase
MSDNARYRVVQWATGNIGRCSLKGIIGHPQMDLAGLYVSSPDKVGRDAGELCGLNATGVCATDNVDEIVALDADCVLYMRQGCDIDEVCRLLASGKNIVTTRGEFHHPRTMEPDIRRRIEQACAAGHSSIYSTGSSPGFATEALPLALLSLQRRVDCLTIDEYADVSRRDSPDLLFEVMGFARPIRPVHPGTLHHIRESFATSLGQIADAIGLPIDEFAVSGEYATATRDVAILAGTIPQGTAGAQRISVEGKRAGRTLLRFRASWYCTRDIDRDWDLQETGWRMRLEGDTPLDVRIAFPIPLDQYTAVMPGLTAHRAINAVPAVCAAPPGIRTTVDLPQIIAAF